MASEYERFHGLWRATANESVPYTEDFPEALLCFPELVDGSIGQGQATEITIYVKYHEDNKLITFTVLDNGCGITNERRLLTWAAAKSSDNTHRNGHGVKKALTKFSREYTTAIWSIRYRKKNKNLLVLTPPFLGPSKEFEEDEHDQTTLTPHGTEISVTFPKEVLGTEAMKVETSKQIPYGDSPKDLLSALREILRTRYSEAIFERITFDLHIQTKENEHFYENSRWNLGVHGERQSLKSEHERWHTFQWYLEQMTQGQSPKAFKLRDAVVHPMDGGHWTFTLYKITVPGSTSYDLKKDEYFPVYGRKNQQAQRIHAALEHRFIEAIPVFKVLGKEVSHNSENGYIGFVQFFAATKDDFEKLPPPATTKVSFYENDPIFRKFIMELAPDLGAALKESTSTHRPRSPSPPTPPSEHILNYMNELAASSASHGGAAAASSSNAVSEGHGGAAAAASCSAAASAPVAGGAAAAAATEIPGDPAPFVPQAPKPLLPPFYTKLVSNDHALLKQFGEFVDHYLSADSALNTASLKVTKKANKEAKEASAHLLALARYFNGLV